MILTSLTNRTFKAFLLSFLFHLLLFGPFVLPLSYIKIESLNFFKADEFYVDSLEITKNIFSYQFSKPIKNPSKTSLKNVDFHPSLLNKSYPYDDRYDNPPIKREQSEEGTPELSKNEISPSFQTEKETNSLTSEKPEKSSSNPFYNTKDNFYRDSFYSLPKRLVYEIFYGPLKVGETQIVIEENKVRALVYTTGLGNTIYPFFARWETWIDENGFPRKTLIYSKDSEKERKKEILFEVENSTVKTKKLLPEERPEEIYKLTYPLYDELSSFVFSWLVDYNNQEKVFFPVYIKEKRETIQVSFKRKTICKFKTEEKECLELSVLAPEKSELLKRAREITIYLLKNEKIPLEVKGKIPLFGSLTGRLKELSW